jgi:hypothetical protein
LTSAHHKVRSDRRKLTSVAPVATEDHNSDGNDDVSITRRYCAQNSDGRAMMMSALPVATMLKTVMDDADVINTHRYYACSKMKRHASSPNSRLRLLEWSSVTPYKLECGQFL